MSIGRRLGPLFGLNAVSAVGVARLLERQATIAQRAFGVDLSHLESVKEIRARATALGAQVVIALARACVVGWPSPSTTPAALVRGLSVHLHAGGVREANRGRNRSAWSLNGHSKGEGLGHCSLSS